jgi:virginiamycin B lyase
MSSDMRLAEGRQLVGSVMPSPALRSLSAKLASFALIVGSILGVTVVSASAAGSMGFKVSNSQNLPPVYSNWPKNHTNWPCYATRSYTCTQGGYGKSAAESSGWPWSEYGGANASENKYGPHNCTLYAAFRLETNGVADPGNLGNAVSWATNAAAKGIQVNQTPSVGAIAQWNAGAGGDGHVAYVESVDAGGSGITITEDNFVPATATSFPGGYTAEIHITRGSAVWPANFIHFPTSSPKPLVTNYTGKGIDGPQGIAAGPDGALWFTNSTNNSVGRITTAGVVTTYTGKGISDPTSIVAGPDGALWFTNYANSQQGSIGRITTAGKVTNYTEPRFSGPETIAVGPDGDLWFTNLDNNSIGRITTAGKVTNYTGSGIDGPFAIAAGRDGALWFTNNSNFSIGRITTAGVVSNYTATSIYAPYYIAAGPDGSLWFTNNNNSIGRITTAGVVSNYTGAGIAYPNGITAGPDGALWFTNIDNNSIGRITTTGTVTDYTGTGISEPLDIVVGPDGALWFTNFSNNSIGRITTG